MAFCARACSAARRLRVASAASASDSTSRAGGTRTNSGNFRGGTNQIAELRYVTLGKMSAEQVEVLSGLQGGEKFVAEPGDRDFSGKQIVSAP